MKLGILGFGKMGEAIAQGLLSSSSSEGIVVSGTTYSRESAAEANRRFSKKNRAQKVKSSLNCHTDNQKLVNESDVILLCVKPHQAEEVLNTIARDLRKRQLIISICAALTTQQISDWSGNRSAIIRAMPNTPCLIGQGMTVFCPGPRAQERDLSIAKKIFSVLGETAVVEEKLMDGVTGLSGCGPAYVYLMIEALSEAGVKMGLSRSVATLLSAQTLAGAAQMVLQRGVHPAALKDEVTTPAGCTIDGLMALEEGKLRVTLIKAVLAAAQRSKTLRET